VAAPILQPVARPPRTGNVDPASLGVEGALAVVDFEFTGIDPAVDRIVDVGIVWYRKGERREWHSLVNPGVPIPPTASAVHHITDEDVAGAPTFEAVAPTIKWVLRHCVVAAHAAELDALILGAELGEHIEPSDWICTWRLARHLYPLAPAFGNQELRYWLKTKLPENDRPHRALPDARVTFEIALHMLKDLPPSCLTPGIDLRAVRDLANSRIPVDYMPFGPFVGVPLRRVPRKFLVRAIGADGRAPTYPHLDVDLRASIELQLNMQGAAHVL
jgi:DNA polymerase III epsilon subunit-like protein